MQYMFRLLHALGVELVSCFLLLVSRNQYPYPPLYQLGLFGFVVGVVDNIFTNGNSEMARLFVPTKNERSFCFVVDKLGVFICPCGLVSNFFRV